MYRKTLYNRWIIAVHFISAMAYGTRLTSGLLAEIQKHLEKKEIIRDEAYTLYLYEGYKPKEEDVTAVMSMQNRTTPVVYPSGSLQSRRLSHPVIENILREELASGDYKFEGIVIRNLGYTRQKIYEITKGSEKIYLSDSQPYDIGILLGTTNVEQNGFICGKRVYSREPVLALGPEYDDFGGNIRRQTTFCSGHCFY